MKTQLLGLALITALLSTAGFAAKSTAAKNLKMVDESVSTESSFITGTGRGTGRGIGNGTGRGIGNGTGRGIGNGRGHILGFSEARS